MPRRSKGARKPGTPQLNMASRIRAGKVTPLISNSLSNDLVLGGHNALVAGYSDYIEYPLERNKDRLPPLIQFKNVTDEAMAEPWDLAIHYLDFIKNRLFDIAEAEGIPEDILAEVEEEFDDLPFSEFSERLGYPDFHRHQGNALLLLAHFPLPLYLTTSPHNFIEVALRQAGKTPRTEICRWHTGLDGLPSVLAEDYDPSPETPLVYHLHGLDEHPDSLILTEDNYLEFLVAVSEHRGKEDDRIADRVRQAMAESTLLLLGYSLRRWDFRSVFWGLIKQRPRQPRSVSIQLKPDNKEELYLQLYLNKARFDVYWGDAHQYIGQLWEELEG